MCVYVCVWGGERERESERERWGGAGGRERESFRVVYTQPIV